MPVTYVNYRHNDPCQPVGTPRDCTARHLGVPLRCTYMEASHGVQWMIERPRLLMLDLLETYARERNVDVWLERSNDRDVWTCILNEQGVESVLGVGRTAVRRSGAHSSRPGSSSGADAARSPSHPDPNVMHPEERPMIWSDDDPRDALQTGDVVTADGVPYIVTADGVPYIVADPENPARSGWGPSHGLIPCRACVGVTQALPSDPCS
jgi:hypothetical protein